MLIGNKESFAIEWTNNKSQVSPVLVWIGGDYLGTLEDSQPLGVVCHQLVKLSNNLKYIGFSAGVTDSVDTFDALLADESGRHLVSLGDTFDDFCILAYTNQNDIYFIWRLESDPFFNYPNYGREIKSFKVHVPVFLEVLSMFRDSLEDMKKYI